MSDKEIEKRLDVSLSKLDNIKVKTPDLLFFASLVNDEKQHIAKKQNQQFTVFIAISLFIVATVTLCLFTNILLFAFIESIPLMLFCLILIYKKIAGDRG